MAKDTISKMDSNNTTGKVGKADMHPAFSGAIATPLPKPIGTGKEATTMNGTGKAKTKVRSGFDTGGPF